MSAIHALLWDVYDIETSLGKIQDRMSNVPIFWNSHMRRRIFRRIDWYHSLLPKKIWNLELFLDPLRLPITPQRPVLEVWFRLWADIIFQFTTMWPIYFETLIMYILWDVNYVYTSIYFFWGWNFFKNKGQYCRILGFNLPRILRGQTPRVIKYANMLIMFWGQLSRGLLSRGQLSGEAIVRGAIVQGAIVRIPFCA